PETLAGFKGKEITVRLRQPNSATVGEQAVFYTNGWIYGQGLAVVEVGRADAARANQLRPQITAALEKNRDKDLQERLARADLVVAGKVTATRPHGQTDATPQSEHDPQWWEATVAVDAPVLRGNAGATVTVLFPSSKDEMWTDAPKFQPGQE